MRKVACAIVGSLSDSVRLVKWFFPFCLTPSGKKWKAFSVAPIRRRAAFPLPRCPPRCRNSTQFLGQLAVVLFLDNFFQLGRHLGDWLKAKLHLPVGSFPDHRVNLAEVFAFLAGIVIARKAKTSDRKSTRLNSSHQILSYAVFCSKKKNL